MNNLRHFFGLKRDPFPQNIPVKDLYPIPGLKSLEQKVFFAIGLRAISVITGDVGSGKSTSLRYVASKCHSNEYHLIPMVGGSYSIMELYRQILLSLGIIYQAFQVTMLIKKIRETVLEIASRKVVPLLIIDEAHLLKRAVFTQLHTLTQFDYDSRPVMPIILCGQEQLLDHLMTLNARPLASRVLGRNHLEALRKEVMEEYLNHHLKLAGSTKKTFSDEAIFAIHQASGGLLRKANSIAKTAMMAAAIDNCQSVSAEHVRTAVTEIFV